MARNFTGTDYIELALGGLGVFSAGTLAIICRKSVDNASSMHPFAAALNDDAHAWYPSIDNGGTAGRTLFWNGSVDSAALTSFLLAADNWCLIVFAKAAGSSTLNAYKYKYSTTTWSGPLSMGALADSASPGTGSAIGAARQAGSTFSGWKGDIEIVGYRAAELTQSQIETSGLESSYSAWQTLFTTDLWPLNQASTATAVTDTTGNGANQSAISGTTVVSGPAGFSYGGAAGKAPPPPRRFPQALLIR